MSRSICWFSCGAASAIATKLWLAEHPDALIVHGYAHATSWLAMAACRRAGIPVIGVEFGYTEVPIAELKPDLLVGHMRDLPEAVSRLLPPA